MLRNPVALVPIAMSAAAPAIVLWDEPASRQRDR